ncbi:hypothetical protein BOX15_Mlig018549g2 [Macrostomum lignano]|uniref:Cubilin n=1 Tax=Macrostomum lignano TaxID=282301 RepID=A0A267G8L6_9PLAT|nr:hypothetical protein BOX15_Mlig018549g2 [Macrostomum lignano]
MLRRRAFCFLTGVALALCVCLPPQAQGYTTDISAEATESTDSASTDSPFETDGATIDWTAGPAPSDAPAPTDGATIDWTAGPAPSDEPAPTDGATIDWTAGPAPSDEPAPTDGATIDWTAGPAPSDAPAPTDGATIDWTAGPAPSDAPAPTDGATIDWTAGPAPSDAPAPTGSDVYTTAQTPAPPAVVTTATNNDGDGIIVDPSKLCDSAPCKNGATCRTTSTYFECTCVPGYNGFLCEIDIDDCATNPCVRGSCIDRVNAYQCVCPAGWSGTNCNTDIDECSSSPCHVNAICSNNPGSFSCACSPGYYGDGYTCIEQMILPTDNGTKLTTYDFNNYTVSYITIETEAPFIIGSRESTVCKISKDGYLSFSNPPYQLTWPTWYTYLVKPMVFPYWSYRYSFAYPDSAVYYELLDSSQHSNTQNWKKVVEIITSFSGGDTYNPLNALIVTWNKMQPYSYYYYYCHYCNYYYKQLGYSWAQYYCKYCDPKQEHISFQAIVTRNESHSFVIFNYGQFEMSEWRWWYYYVAAGFTDGYQKFDRLPFSYYWWRSNYVTDNKVMGNVGKVGRHVRIMADSIPPSDKLKCKKWMDNERKRPLTTKLSCRTCPRDMRQAVLDWRYWPYEYSCDKKNQNEKGNYKLTMCFRGRFECVQNFTNPPVCPYPWWNWYCNRFMRCQFYAAPRCCYKLKVHWKKDGQLVDYCDAGYSVWSMRWRLRNIMFDRRQSGSLIKSTVQGAGHSMILERTNQNYWWWIKYDEQLRNETYGYDVCRAGKVIGKYKKFRPKCNSREYTEPAWGFNRGDPHISTIDGITYSFNGLCEYYMIRNSSQSAPMLELQARTGLAKSLNPNVTASATVFIGFALKAGSNNCSISVLLNTSSNDLDVYKDNELLGSVLTYFSEQENSTTIEKYTLKSNDNKSISISESDTGFSVTVDRVLSLLQASVQLDQLRHASEVEGLMGNFNGNKTDDFKLRNGTLFPGNSSERDLFHFGQSWALQSSDVSHFPYPAGKTRADFCNLSFVPVFVEDYKDNLLDLFHNNSELMTSANKTCWNAEQSIYLSCMYDAAQLQSLDAAEEASLAVSQEVSAKAVASNFAPEFNMPTNITVHSSTTFNLTINVTDKDGNPIVLSIQEPSNDTLMWLDGNVLVWQVGINISAFNLTIVATDSMGAPTSWTPVVLYIDCENGATHSFNYTTGETVVGENFYRAQCSCPSGYQGDRCDVTPCSAQPNPCYNASMCHMYSNGSYYCDSCPDGMVGDGQVCEDTNECLETPGICQEQCTNLVPGYRCNCTTPGFRVSPSNSSLCEDIDECATGDNRCRADQNQTCVNTNGSYTCTCPMAGFKLNALYECEDINECRNPTNPCGGDYICVNDIGSYSCECAQNMIRVNGKCVKVVIRSTDSATTAPIDDSSNTVLIISLVIGGVLLMTVIVSVAIIFGVRTRVPVEGLFDLPSPEND